MSEADSEPKGKLAWMTPMRAFVAVLDAFGIEAVGIDELDLTPACVERARAERGDVPLRKQTDGHLPATPGYVRLDPGTCPSDSDTLPPEVSRTAAEKASACGLVPASHTPEANVTFR